MNFFKKRGAAAKAQLRQNSAGMFGMEQFTALSGENPRIYRAMREAVPILDAAVQKLVRLTGGFSAACADGKAEEALNRFLKTVPCGRGQQGMDCFLNAYLGSLLTDGRAVGEMVLSGEELAAVCWGDAARLTIREEPDSLDPVLCGPDAHGTTLPLPYPELLLFTTLNPEPGNPYGVSLFRPMPFLAEILMKIYKTVGRNWERAGNVRYSVVYKPEGDGLDRAYAAERAEQMAGQWAEAMRETGSGAVRDFVAVGDVAIKVIGADGQILDSEVPVRQILEQLVAATGLPPFLLGLSWSTSERMSAQQADLLTSELWSIRRAVEPALRKVCAMWLRLKGYGGETEIVWEDICLQDLVEEAQAGLYRAQTEKIRSELESAGTEET